MNKVTHNFITTWRTLNGHSNRNGFSRKAGENLRCWQSQLKNPSISNVFLPILIRPMGHTFITPTFATRILHIESGRIVTHNGKCVPTGRRVSVAPVYLAFSYLIHCPTLMDHGRYINGARFIQRCMEVGYRKIHPVIRTNGYSARLLGTISC